MVGNSYMDARHSAGTRDKETAVHCCYPTNGTWLRPWRTLMGVLRAAKTGRPMGRFQEWKFRLSWFCDLRFSLT
jgi:hypothetical protein